VPPESPTRRTGGASVSDVTRATTPRPAPLSRAQFPGVVASDLVESADLRKHPEKLASG